MGFSFLHHNDDLFLLLILLILLLLFLLLLFNVPPLTLLSSQPSTQIQDTTEDLCLCTAVDLRQHCTSHQQLQPHPTGRRASHTTVLQLDRCTQLRCVRMRSRGILNLRKRNKCFSGLPPIHKRKIQSAPDPSTQGPTYRILEEPILFPKPLIYPE